MHARAEAPKRRRRDQGFGDAYDLIPVTEILRGEVERRAYQLFIARGCQHGRDIEDWLTAERELLMPRDLTS
jgi:hypothetical protein